jgi:hypothetical protein
MVGRALAVVTRVNITVVGPLLVGWVVGYGPKSQAALQVCDALCADWLSLRQQRLRELREAVVAAVAAART